MWNQWSQYAGAPPLPTTAPPPPPQEPAAVQTPVAPAIIGPMLPSATTASPLTPTVVPTAVPTLSMGATAAPAAAGANPYSQYTAAQYAAMTAEQQFALQQHWMQWQKYQEEYAKWHAQYGEQYKREMEMAQNTKTTTPAAPAAAATPAYGSSFFQQPPPPAATGKISGQPQLYSQPPPLQTATASTSNPINYPAPSLPQQQPWQPPQQPTTYNQPPPNFNQQNANANNLNINKQQNPWGGPPPQTGTGEPPTSDNSQYNRNVGGNQGKNFANTSNSWPEQATNRPVDSFNNNMSGNRDNVPNNRSNNNWNINQNVVGGNRPPENYSNRDIDQANRFEGASVNNFTAVAPADKIAKIEDKNDIKDDLNNSGPKDRNIGGPSNWSDRGSYQANDSNRVRNNWNEDSNDRNFGQNNRGPNNNRGANNWNDASNTPDNDNKNNRGPGDRNFGSNNWNQGPNNRNSGNWGDGRNNRNSINWNDSCNNRGPNNWNDGRKNWNDMPNNRDNSGPNDWSDNRTVDDRNNCGPTNWNDNSNDASNRRGQGDRNFGQNSHRNNRPSDQGNSGPGRRGPDNNSPNNLGRNEGPNQRNYQAPGNCSGPANRGRVTDLDEEMFDRQFGQWEQQFEDWKKANANHPDREMYKRYEQEFEKQRKRIAERREQMRRRKLEQMGLNPNLPPPPPQQPQLPQSSNFSRNDSAVNDNSVNPEPIGRKRNDSIGSQQSSHSKQNQDLISETNQEINPEINPKINSAIAPEIQPPTHKPSDKVEELAKDTENSDATKVLNDESNKTDAVKENPQQKKNSLGKRKSRFDAPAVQPNKIKTTENTEIITLDDDDAGTDYVDKNQGNMTEIFKKVDGIPGLDLADGTSLGPTEPSTINQMALKPEETTDQTKFNKNQLTTPTATAKKIPSLFDIKVDKPDMTDLNKVEKINEEEESPSSSTALPDLAKSLNDPDFLKKISEAVAHAKGTSDKSRVQEGDDRQLSFSEWQQQKQGDGSEETVDPGNTNSRESFRDRSSNRQETVNDFNPNSSGRGGDDSVGNANMNVRYPNLGPNNNFGPNGPTNWGPNGNNNNWGPNGPNNCGPNGSNSWGPNGPNNWGNNGQNNNWGPNNSNNNNNPNNYGPNNWGPNNNFGPNNSNNRGPNGPNNWGPNGPNNWGPNGPNNWGPNGSDDNFRGGNNYGPNGPGRNFGGNSSNYGPNDGPGYNFGRNDGPGNNFARNGPNFGRNGPNFGPNEGPTNNFGNDGNNYGPNDNRGRNVRHNDGPRVNFDNDGFKSNKRNRGRGGSNDRRDGSKNRGDNNGNRRDNSNNRNNANKDGNNSEDTATPNRNINNPFRRNDIPKVATSETDDFNNSKDQTNSWIQGPAGRDNLDYGDYYRPVQVIDYSNSNATPTTTITPRVIDYGHKPVANTDSNAFKPLKIINYDHASKAKNPQQQARFNAPQKRKKRKNKNNPQQQKNKQQQLQQQQQQQKQQQKNLNQPQQKGKMAPNQEKAEQEQINFVDGENAHEQLEEISDVEDEHEEPQSPPPPPPPMFSTSGTFKQLVYQDDVPFSIFPSTSEANENLPKISSTQVQMIVPTEENNNTISIDEILMKPGRYSRPKKICMILRGPPGSGKSHVAKLIKEKEKEMSGSNPRILSIDDYFLIENDYEEKCPKTGKKLQKKEILYEYDKDMEEKYLEYLVKAFKKSVADNFYDFIVIDCNNNSLRSLNEFYCHAKDSGFVPYIIDLFCDLEACLERNIHERSESDIKKIIDTWKPTPGHYIKLDISSLLQNIIEMEDAEDMAVDDNTAADETTANITTADNDQHETDNCPNEADNCNQDIDEDSNDEDSNDSKANCGFLKSKWETDTITENLARLDGTSKLSTKRKPTMEEYLQMDEWEPPTNTKGKKRVRWADIEEKRKQQKMRAVGFVVGQTDWKRMMDPYAAKRALNKTKYIERLNKKR